MVWADRVAAAAAQEGDGRPKQGMLGTLRPELLPVAGICGPAGGMLPMAWPKPPFPTPAW